MDASLIAPCGINCALCLAYQRTKNRCPGCRDESLPKTEYRLCCTIKNCERMAQNGWRDCSPCEHPCARMKSLDKRYRTKYNTNVLENLASIKNDGIDAFLARQAEQWTCRTCGGLMCMHRGKCLKCGDKA